MLKKEKFFSAVVLLIGLLGIYGSISLPISERFTLGPGATPLIYSSGLIICSILVWLRASDEKAISLKTLLKPPNREGLLFLALNFGLGAIVYFLGFAIGLVLFCFSALVLIKKWEFRSASLFSIAWSLAIYVIFSVLLDVPFLKGMFFER